MPDMIIMLTSKQRAFLKSQAHSMKPIVQIGMVLMTKLKQVSEMLWMRAN